MSSFWMGLIGAIAICYPLGVIEGRVGISLPYAFFLNLLIIIGLFLLRAS